MHGARSDLQGTVSSKGFGTKGPRQGIERMSC
jgi:hypothetical protein